MNNQIVKMERLALYAFHLLFIVCLAAHGSRFFPKVHSCVHGSWFEVYRLLHGSQFSFNFSVYSLLYNSRFTV